MSWFFGIIHNNLSREDIEQFSSIHSTPLHTIQTDNLYLAAGGITETCCYGKLPTQIEERERIFCVVGCGLKKHNAGCAVLSNDDWAQLLLSGNVEEKVQMLDGHFAALMWDGKELKCYTDQLGLRSIYLSEVEYGIVFSTRLDWAAQASNNNEIDFNAFGSRWLTFSQLSYKSLVNGIQRLGPNGVAVCDSHSIHINHRLWKPEFTKTSPETFFPSLYPFLHPESVHRRSLSFGLSGGLDSRFILSLLVHQQEQFAMHVFGDSFHPDVYLAKRLAEFVSLPVTQFNEPIPERDVSITLMKDFAAHSCVNEPASKIMRVRYLPQIHSARQMMIDGGYVEIFRRQLFNRLLKRGKSALRENNPSAIFPFLRVTRPAIFRTEFVERMVRSSEGDIESFFSSMPPVKSIGEENFSDMLALNALLPNSSGFEQSRTDAELVSYMPCVQPSFLQAVFQLPLSEKKNGKLVYKTIHNFTPEFSTIPLAKGNITYPYGLPTIPAWLWRKVKSKFGMVYNETEQIHLYVQLKEFVLDTLHSEAVKTYPAYNYLFLEDAVTQFYEGNRELVNVIDWWMSFELWRQSLKIKSSNH